MKSVALALHEEFRVVNADDGWRAECKSCSWTGPWRGHPLDCAEDSIAHTKEKS